MKVADSINLVSIMRAMSNLQPIIFMFALAFLLLSFNLPSVKADGLFGKIEGRLQFPDRTPFNETIRITLNHGEYATYTRVQDNGSFTLYNVRPGIHVLDIHSTFYHFSQVKCQFLDKDMNTPKCLEYYYPGANKQPVQEYPLVLTAFATYDYFEKRTGFSFQAILMNPMVLMMVVMVGLMFMMPKMMEGLDPEEKERVKRQMEMQKDPTKMLGQLWGDISGSREEEESTRRRIKK